MTKDKVKEFNENNVYTGLSKKPYGRTYFAKRDFEKGEIVMMGFGEIINHQTPHISVQIGLKKHYLPTSWTGKYWNHSCSPNTYMKTRSDGFPELIASSKIRKGDEITYSYWMSEYEWTRHADESRIRCKCGSKNCRGRILSFSQLTEAGRKALRKTHTCSKYLLAVK